ncbi:MAG: amino acid permease [Actinobacteria bacterium]|nr:amino acid permease [Actinomycetota bacterium]
MSDTAAHHDEDAARLAALGYTSEFKRDMSLWANFSLGFTYLSPVVGIYSLFAISLAVGGPPMIWSLIIVGVGQFLVAQVFSEVVAQYPVAGGVYPWARRLWGKKWAWMTGWVYLVALLATIASVTFGAGPYVAAVVGIEPTIENAILCALALLVIATIINFGGTKVLSYAAIAGFTAEIVGALVVGVWLLLFHREQSFTVLFDTFGTEGDGSYLPAFAAAALIGIYQYYGFEACGDVAEEVPNPGVRIPKSMRRTIYIGGAAATFVCLSLILSVTDINAVISGEDADPVGTVLAEAFGETGSKIVLVVVLLSFISCAMSLQAAASRLAYSYGRDKMIIGSGLWSKFSQTRHVPPYALLLAAVVPALIVISAKFSTDALTKIISFAALGIYIAFAMVVLAALRARLKGWKPSGKFQLGRWGMPITIAALVYQVIAMLNMAWPRTPDASFVDNYIVALSAAVVIGFGLLYMAIAKPYDRGDAPHGDAIDADTWEHQHKVHTIESI